MLPAVRVMLLWFTVAGSIASLNVKATVLFKAAADAPQFGTTRVMVGAVVSVMKPVVNEHTKLV